MLCTKLYHCTPTELDQQQASRVRLHLKMWTADLEDQQRRRDKKAGRKVIRKSGKRKRG